MGGERNNFIHCDCGDLHCMYESLEGKILGGHCVQESLLISHSHIYGVATDRFAKKKKFGTLHEFACHPCAGAMLIFSVSFQFSICSAEATTLVTVAHSYL